MTIEARIYAALAPLVAGRVFPDLAPEKTPRPYVVFQQVGGQAVAFVDPTVPSMKNGRFQVAVWADTRVDAAALAAQVEDVLRVDPLLQTTALGAPVATYDADTGLRGTRQDFSFWF